MNSAFLAPFSRHMLRLSVCVVLLLLTACGSSGAQPTLSGRLVITGSTALQPLVSQAAALFQQQNPLVHVVVQPADSTVGLNALMDKHADVANTIIYADPGLYPDPNLTDHIVAAVPFVIIVNRDVVIKSVTSQQLIDIFVTGKYQNWNQLGGPSLKIVPTVAPVNSGVRAIFHRYVLAGNDEQAEMLEAKTTSAVLTLVATTPGAIGYLAAPLLDSGVRTVAISEQAANAYSVEAGIYPFWSYGHMYTLGNENPVLAAYLNFMLGNAVQSLAQKMHYIPVSDMKPTS